MARSAEKSVANIFSSDDTEFEALAQTSAAIPQKRLIKKPLFHDEIQNDNNNRHEPKKMKGMPLPPSDYIPRNKKNIPSTKNLSQDLVKGGNHGSIPNRTPSFTRSTDALTSSASNTRNDNVYYEGEYDQQEYDTQEYGEPEYLEFNQQESDRQEKFCNENGYSTMENIDNVLSDIDNIPGNVDNIPSDIDSIPGDINDNDNNDEIQNSKHQTCGDTCRTIQKMILSQKRKIDLIINLLTNSNTYVQSNKCETELLPNFPLLTIEDFSKFETNLQTDREIRKQFKSKIASIGGKSYAHKTRNIMKFILADNVCQLLSWTGKKGSTAVKDTAFVDIILDYVSHIEKCTLHEVQKVIQERLRHAGDRVNYAKKTQKV